MASSNNITDKAARAVRDFLKTKTFSNIPPAQIYKSHENTTVADDETSPVTRLLPCIEVICRDAEAEDEHFLSWLVHVEVSVRSNADDTTDADHATQVEEVYNELTVSTLASDLTATLAGFSAFLVNFTGESNGMVERSFQSTLRFDVHCVGDDIT